MITTQLVVLAALCLGVRAVHGDVSSGNANSRIRVKDATKVCEEFPCPESSHCEPVNECNLKFECDLVPRCFHYEGDYY